MLPEGNPQWSGCARHLSEGLVQLLQRFYIEITDSRAICRASDQQYMGRVGSRCKRSRTQTSLLSFWRGQVPVLCGRIDPGAEP